MQYSLSRLISKSRKPVTILFTDIVDSTRLWDTRGDVKGRLLVDQHNRLVFPVIKKFRGNVIKTIGDAVMASFSSPENALRAAVGIQQALAEYRQKNKHFKLQIRIGLHSGMALIEKRDVFGDTVNVAARIEGLADADEILISGSSEKSIKRSEFCLSKKTSFIPKGKKKEIAVFSCDWQQLPSQIEKINFNALLPLLGRQRYSMFFYMAGIMAMVYFGLSNYVRYILADQENVYLLSFSPQQILSDQPILAAALCALAMVMIYLIRYLSVMPIMLFKLMKGLFWYSVVFAMVLMLASSLPPAYTFNSKDTFFESAHLFVEVLQDDATIHEQPALDSKVLKTVNARDLFLLSDVSKQENLVWNKILIGTKKYGWIVRETPPAFGVEEKRLTIANKFHFRFRDFYALLIALFGFLWGYFSFSIRPL
ncbi:MAG: adenylate/guanylate cyclase domain-containing protein [Gammaproteobacteria bacterium]|nr:adenylate/guanylate cyclase domain-containing protein [Gammaproteobacteria bacterium]